MTQARKTPSASDNPAADYFCTGPVWPTPTKPGRPAPGLGDSGLRPGAARRARRDGEGRDDDERQVQIFALQDFQGRKAKLVRMAKTGGVAEVVGALPAELVRQGHQVTVYLPLYRQVQKHLKERKVAIRSQKGDRIFAVLKDKVIAID